MGGREFSVNLCGISVHLCVSGNSYTEEYRSKQPTRGSQSENYSFINFFTEVEVGELRRRKYIPGVRAETSIE